MKTTTAFLISLAAVFAGCATEPEKSAPPPAPVASPAPPPAPIAEPAPPPVAPKSAPAPLARPEPKTASVVTIASTELFEFNKATLTAEARAKLDREVVARAKDFSSISLVHIDGHADRLGSAQYNQQLSQKRAEAVRAYLVSKGFDGSKLATLGSGENNPVKSCADLKDRSGLIDCLAPNRRVVVEVKGTPR